MSIARLGLPPQAVYAVPQTSPGGRRIAELPAPTRSDFQRDRDRIVHCTAFRRLVYKTQVFLNHEGDLFRTRLTHSLEVAQLGRSIARSLGLNEDLVEAISLAHDLGHTPFGHAGQDALNDCMADHGGFEHNLQSLRVVDALEQRYPGWDGLNLCLETREGILKRCPLPLAAQIEAREPAGVARRFIDGTQPSLEAQLCNLADEIAYNAHDIDDGVRSGLLSLAALRVVPLFARFDEEVQRDHPGLATKAPRRLLAEIIRRMLSAQVYDVIDSASEAIAVAAPASCDAVRQQPALIRFTADMRHASAELKRFLFRELYRHPQVMDTTQRGRRIITELFAAYLHDPQQLPEEHRGLDAAGGIGPRCVADYIAGMTDRFATREHERLTGRRVFLDD
ncbi:MAG TPA: deoxyguanosinetriphosphate triphosphohydrolase [Ideonella sp.]|uniref:deoxyguanosinetriphosphate triphosphohydrolase n=1 Tax=Ideonella sp. TaxID=1929293 RepID=UPI002C662EDC|nr:deoxyguanosinetriphosphate triphosphohydrolase [Ideonella sp.]HSI49297.1 deoxyguanosinetriphosphate triphosphohydrolase [Ideonella sp.]